MPKDIIFLNYDKNCVNGDYSKYLTLEVICFGYLQWAKVSFVSDAIKKIDDFQLDMTFQGNHALRAPIALFDTKKVMHIINL